MTGSEPEILVGWLYDKVEARFGRAAAWLASIAVAIALLAAIVSIPFVFF